MRLLVELLDRSPLAFKLRDALVDDPKTIVALSVQEGVELLAVLDDPPARLKPLKATLLAQFRQRDQRIANAREEDDQRNGTSG